MSTFFICSSLILYKCQDDELGDDDAAKHREGIDGGVADCRVVAGHDVVGIVEGHGIGHAAA